MADEGEPWDLRGTDVAKLLDCNESQVYRLSRSGRLPFRKTVGGQRRYRLSDVRRLAADLEPRIESSGLTLDERVTALEEWRRSVEPPD